MNIPDLWRYSTPAERIRSVLVTLLMLAVMAGSIVVLVTTRRDLDATRRELELHSQRDSSTVSGDGIKYDKRNMYRYRKRSIEALR